MTDDQTPKTPNDALTEYRKVAKAPPETAAKKKLAQDLDASEKRYQAIAEVIAAYTGLYADLSGEMLKAARTQHDEAESHVDDPDEVPRALKDKIKQLHENFAEQTCDIERDADAAETALNATRSPLGQAEARVTAADARLTEAVALPDRAKAWFDDVATLSASVKESATAGNMHQAYAQYLELKRVFDEEIKARFEDKSQLEEATPDWLREQLKDAVLALIKAQFDRYKVAATAEAAAATADAANALRKTFVTENGARLAFFRQAQDVVAPTETTTQTISKPEKEVAAAD